MICYIWWLALTSPFQVTVPPQKSSHCCLMGKIKMTKAGLFFDVKDIMDQQCNYICHAHNVTTFHSTQQKNDILFTIYIPNDRPLDTDVLCGSFLTGLWDSKKLSSSRCRAFSMGNVALLLSDMPYWHIILRTQINQKMKTKIYRCISHS